MGNRETLSVFDLKSGVDAYTKQMAALEDTVNIHAAKVGNVEANVKQINRDMDDMSKDVQAFKSASPKVAVLEKSLESMEKSVASKIQTFEQSNAKSINSIAAASDKKLKAVEDDVAKQLKTLRESGKVKMD